MKKIRIMIYNVGYLTGLNGSVSDYIFKSHRIIFPRNNIRKSISEKISTFIKKENPDIVFLPEVKDRHYMTSIKSLFLKSYINTKYIPSSILNHLPFFKGNSNGVFLKEDFTVTKFYLQNGTKKLVYKVDIQENFSVYFAHFALSAKTRKKQFLELAEIMKKDDNCILAGDFNIFDGVKELQELLSIADLHTVNDLTKKTFPSSNPTYAIDLFLASPKVNVTSINVLSDALTSDHLPVVLDLEL